MSVVHSVDALRRDYGHLDGAALLSAMRPVFPGTLGIISSFGAEAAVLLDLVAQVDRTLPVIFVDTGELFDETLVYRDALVARLGLTDVRSVSPSAQARKQAAELWQTDPDRCCDIRKVLPLEQAVTGFAALADGRKRFHGGGRDSINTIEAGLGGVVKISPLARWDPQQIARAFAERHLPAHPLTAQGFRSIGCWPCSRAIGPDEPVRAGRWAGAAKSECGIHKVAVTV